MTASMFGRGVGASAFSEVSTDPECNKPYESGAKTVGAMIILAMDWAEGCVPHLSEEKVAAQLAIALNMNLVARKADGRWKLTNDGHRAQVKRQFRDMPLDVKACLVRQWAAGEVEMWMHADGSRAVVAYLDDVKPITGKGPTLDDALEVIAPEAREFCASEGRRCW